MLGRLLPRHLEIIYLINYNHMEVKIKKISKNDTVRGPYLNDVYYSKFSGFLTPSPHCLHLSDFLELPSLADVIFGLPPQVVPALLLTILVGY